MRIALLVLIATKRTRAQPDETMVPHAELVERLAAAEAALARLERSRVDAGYADAIGSHAMLEGGKKDTIQSLATDSDTNGAPPRNRPSPTLRIRKATGKLLGKAEAERVDA